jgi:phosphoserine phosphatase
MTDQITPLYIFDLDGTLALIEHRRHWVADRKHARWDRFYADCVNDTPNPGVVAIFDTLLTTGNEVLIFSGRGSEVRTETVDWLMHYTGLRTWSRTDVENSLWMRPERDSTPDEILKRRWYNTLLTQTDRQRLVAVFDDRQKVVDMWRSLGVCCCQVAPGYF